MPRAKRSLAVIMVMLHLPAETGSLASARQGPTIRHEGLEYMSSREFARVAIDIDTPELLRTAKLYFRAEQYSDFYYVEMVREDDDTFAAILPIPSIETAAVVYFIEIIDVGFGSFRTTQYHSQVTTQLLPSSFQGTEPNIYVGSTGPSQPNLPPGFRPDGIDGYITQGGEKLDLSDLERGERESTDPEPPEQPTRTGGGGGGGTAVAIIAGVAGATAGGLALLGAKSDEDGQQPLTACFTTSPDPPAIRQGETIRLDGSCSEPPASITSYEWNLGDGRRRQGISVNPAYPTGGTFTVSLTVSDGAQSNTTTRTVTVRANEADLRLEKRYTLSRIFILFDLEVTNQGPDDATGVVLTDTVPTSVKIQPGIAVDDQRVSCTSDGSTLTCKLSLLSAKQGFAVSFRTTPAIGSVVVNTARVTASEFDPNPNNNEGTTTVSLSHRAASVTATSFMSSLKGGDQDAVVRGRVVVNGTQADATRSSAPFRHSLPGREENTVEAYTESAIEGEGYWQFDFSGDQHFIPGSIKVELGQVLARDAYSAVFRLSGAPGEHIKFTYRLRR